MAVLRSSASSATLSETDRGRDLRPQDLRSTGSNSPVAIGAVIGTGMAPPSWPQRCSKWFVSHENRP